MQRVFLLAGLLAVVGLSGCGMFGEGGVDRWEAVKDIRTAEETTKQEFLKTKQLEFQKKDGQKSPTVKITTQDSAGQPVVVEMDLAPVIAAATGKGNNDTYGVQITTTELPEGAVAETIKAVGSAGKDILTTPVAVAGTVGVVIGSALSETGGGGTHINGENINASDSFNRTEVHATGDGNTAGTTARTETAPPVEEEEGV